MRIISKFHDYYDGVMAHGAFDALAEARGPVYAREQREVAEDERSKLPRLPEPKDAPPSLYFSIAGPRGNRNRVIYASSFWLLVAGRVYRGFRLDKRVHGALVATPSEFVYSPEELAAEIAAWRLVDPLDGPLYGNRRYRHYHKQELCDRTAWLSRQGTEELREAAIAAGIVVAGAYLGRAPGRALYPLVLNPRLADFQFWKVMDAYTVFQELSMWCGGVLPQRDAMQARVSDADRFVEHGFDARTSFRGPLRSRKAARA